MCPEPLVLRVLVLVADSLRLDDLAALHARLELAPVVQAVFLLLVAQVSRPVQVCQLEQAERCRGAHRRARPLAWQRELLRPLLLQARHAAQQFGASRHDYKADLRVAADTSVSLQRGLAPVAVQTLQRLAAVELVLAAVLPYPVRRSLTPLAGSGLRAGQQPPR